MVRSDARGRLDLAEMRAERESAYARPAGGRVIIVVPYERTGRKVRGYRRGRSRGPAEKWTVGSVKARKWRR